jgi:hypothetical protein
VLPNLTARTAHGLVTRPVRLPWAGRLKQPVPFTIFAV